MKFEEALKAMREGKKVTRRCYEDSRFYIKGRNIMHYRINEGIDKAVNIAGLGSFDITGEGWEVINENKEKQHTDDAIAYNELVEENTKLKELLKRVNEHFKRVDHDAPFYVEEELWDDIKKALGEDK